MSEPLAWQEIESDPEFQALDYPQKHQVFSGWRDETAEYAKGLGAPDPEVEAFKQRATQRWDQKMLGEVPQAAFSAAGEMIGDLVRGHQSGGSPDNNEEIAALKQQEENLRAAAATEDEKELATGRSGDGQRLRHEAALIRDRLAMEFDIGGGELTRPTEEIQPRNPVDAVLGPALTAQMGKPAPLGLGESTGMTTGGVAGAVAFSGGGPGLAARVLYPMIGALGGGVLGGGVQEALTKAGEIPEATAARQERSQRVRENNPGEYMAGSLLGGSAFFRPSLAQLKGVLTGNQTAQANLGAGMGIGAGMTAGSAALQGRMPTTGELLEGAAIGGLFSHPTSLAQKLFGFRPATTIPDDSTGTVRTPVGTLDSQGEIITPSSPKGVALRAVRGLDATEPTTLPAEPAPIPPATEAAPPAEPIQPNAEGVRAPVEAVPSVEAPAKASEQPAPAEAPQQARVLPPEYQRAVELPAAEAAKELSVPVPEVQRRAAMAKEVLSDKYALEPLPEPTGRGFKDLARPEGGSLGSGGGSSAPKPKPVGLPPSGDANWLEVAPWYKRGGFYREGMSPILQNRQKNAIGKQLGKATDRRQDVEADLFGRMTKDLDAGLSGMPRSVQKAAFDELSGFLREKENGRPTPPLSANAQKLLNSWQDVAEFTGLLAHATGVKVSDKGGYRPMRLLGREYLPRMIAPEVMQAIRDPQRHAVLFNKLAGELAAQRGITVNEAAAFLNDMAGGKSRMGTNDFMGNLEIARQEKLPESFYEYDLRKIIPKYVQGYAQRMGQIIAYGQRLGPESNPIQKNLWDYARDETRGGDRVTAAWLNEGEAQSRNERVLSGSAKLMQRLQTSMTGLLLGNPTSTVPRNLLSGAQGAAELLGYGRTIASARKVFDASERVGARQMGIIKDDIASLLHAEQLPGDSAIDQGIRSVTDTLLKVSGYDASEKFVRTVNMLSASSFARDAAKAMTTKPGSAFAKQAQALIRRMGVDPAALTAEGGEWRTGTETQKFIRKIINDTQGGYKYNQVPLWAGSPAGRFFYQFGRWGTQRSQNLWNNVFKPAFVGDIVKVHGVPMAVRDFKPLARMAVGTVALGEAFAGLGKLFFDRDRKDYSLSEIGTAMNEDGKKAALMIATRLINDVIMGGSLGIWGQPVDLAMAAKDGSRLKNPAEPPALAGTKALVQFGLDFADQGEVTGDDVKRLLQAGAPGITATIDATRNAFDHDKYEAENDVRTLRNAGIRFAQSAGMDVGWRGGGAEARKTERVPVFAGIRDALLTGDVISAKKIQADYLATLKPSERAKAIAAIKSSVRQRQPFRVGPFTTEAVKRDFMAWAKKNLSKEDLNQITRTQGRYEHTAKKLGIW